MACAPFVDEQASPDNAGGTGLAAAPSYLVIFLFKISLFLRILVLFCQRIAVFLEPDPIWLRVISGSTPAWPNRGTRYRFPNTFFAIFAACCASSGVAKAA